MINFVNEDMEKGRTKWQTMVLEYFKILPRDGVSTGGVRIGNRIY
jgi:hypothetical protein